MQATLVGLSTRRLRCFSSSTTGRGSRRGPLPESPRSVAREGSARHCPQSSPRAAAGAGETPGGVGGVFTCDFVPTKLCAAKRAAVLTRKSPLPDPISSSNGWRFPNSASLVSSGGSRSLCRNQSSRLTRSLGRRTGLRAFAGSWGQEAKGCGSGGLDGHGKRSPAGQRFANRILTCPDRSAETLIVTPANCLQCVTVVRTTPPSLAR